MNLENLFEKESELPEEFDNFFIKKSVEILLGDQIKTIEEFEELTKNLQIGEIFCDNNQSLVEYIIPTKTGFVKFQTPGYDFLSEKNIETIIEDCEYGFSAKTALFQAILKELIVLSGYKIPEDLPDEDDVLIKNIQHIYKGLK